MTHQTWPVGLQKQSQPPQPQTEEPQVQVFEKVDPYSEILLKDDQGNVTQLSLENGDLIATALKGPNGGKRCNLTYGRWQ